MTAKQSTHKDSPDLLSKDQLAPTRRFKDVDIPFLENTRVRIRSLNEYEQSQFEAEHIGKNGKPSRSAIQASRRRYLALCLVDEDGNPYLQARDFRDADSRLVNYLYRVCAEHNGLSEDEQETILGN